MAASAGPEIERLIGLLSKLPGLGPRSARRAALALMKRRDQLLGPLTEALADARDRVKTCSTCGTLDTTDPCAICADGSRDASQLLVVEEVGALWAMERGGAQDTSGQIAVFFLNDHRGPVRMVPEHFLEGNGDFRPRLRIPHADGLTVGYNIGVGKCPS